MGFFNLHVSLWFKLMRVKISLTNKHKNRPAANGYTTCTMPRATLSFCPAGQWNAVFLISGHQAVPMHCPLRKLRWSRAISPEYPPARLALMPIWNIFFFKYDFIYIRFPSKHQIDTSTSSAIHAAAIITATTTTTTPLTLLLTTLSTIPLSPTSIYTPR